MAKIPIKFRRVAAAFDEATRRQRPCDSSSGSEYWPDSGTSLSDLVNSFLEREGSTEEQQFEIDEDINIDHDTTDNHYVSDNEDGSVNKENKPDNAERKELLGDLLSKCGIEGGKNRVKQRIYQEIEVALEFLIGSCSHGTMIISSSSTSRSGLKRSLMAHLRERGFDAGLCKSRWEKTSRFPAGSYEYIDVNEGKNRYIVEVFLSGEFEIARPTTQYASLLGMIPSIIISEKPQTLKQLMRLMSSAMRESLNHVGMYIPPWRRNGYMQAKYFSSYKRTTNKEPSSNISRAQKDESSKKRSIVGFEADLFTRIPYSYCRVLNFAEKGDVRVGILDVAYQ